MVHVSFLDDSSSFVVVGKTSLMCFEGDGRVWLFCAANPAFTAPAMIARSWQLCCSRLCLAFRQSFPTELLGRDGHSRVSWFFDKRTANHRLHSFGQESQA